MGVAALVIGIVSLVLGFIPFCGIIALVPAIVGLTLGIIDWVKKNKVGQPKGKAIAGTICSGVAIIIIMFYYFAVIVVAKNAAGGLNEFAKELESYDWNTTSSYTYDNDDYDFSDYDYDFE